VSRRNGPPLEISRFRIYRAPQRRPRERRDISVRPQSRLGRVGLRSVTSKSLDSLSSRRTRDPCFPENGRASNTCDLRRTVISKAAPDWGRHPAFVLDNSSNSLRSPTAPGVTEEFLADLNAPVSTIDGCRGSG